jgi:hypothetical protein
MLVNKFKEYCESLNWVFNYGNYDWQNLIDIVNEVSEGVPPDGYFLLFYKDREKKFNQYNALQSETFTGEFIYAKQSDFTEKDYNFKYENRISQMETDLDNFHLLISDCIGLYIEAWSEAEVSNILDANFDGIKVKFRIRHEV